MPRRDADDARAEAVLAREELTLLVEQYGKSFRDVAVADQQ
jgi:hypothetical protein